MPKGAAGVHDGAGMWNDGKMELWETLQQSRTDTTGWVHAWEAGTCSLLVECDSPVRIW